MRHRLVVVARLAGIWHAVRTSFWFLPVLVVGGAIALSVVLVEIDSALDWRLDPRSEWFYVFGAEGGRAILSAIAASMITVAGLTSSITMLTLQLASSQFGPRLLRNFMIDRGNQIVLGTFVGTFVYCLLVLRTVRATDETTFVPHLGIAVGVALAIASIAILIYFIHHTARSIRIETLLASLADETRETIERLYPDRIGRDAPAPASPPALPDFDAGGCAIQSPASGYVQYLDEKALMRAAVEEDLAVRIEARPGRFVVEGDPLLSAFPAARVGDELRDTLRAALVLGDQRTPEQDLDFAIHRVVEIAQRALSPGVNDPSTAIYCLDRLEEAFVRLAGRAIPSPIRLDEEGRVRVVTEVTSLDELAARAFGAVARYGRGDADVLRRLLAALSRVMRETREPARARLGELRERLRREGASSPAPASAA